MISIITKFINLIALTIQKFLLIASFTGRVIVAIITGISAAVSDIVQYVLLFFEIIYEDNVSIFKEDIPNFVNNVISTINDQIFYLQNALIFMYQGLEFKSRRIAFAIKYFFDGFFVIVSEVMFLLKNSVIFLGDTLWLIITFIPVHLPQILRVVLKCTTDVIVNVIVDTYLGLLKITNFLTDVPLESFIGIISAIIIFRLIIHYRETIQSLMITCYWSIIRKILYVYYLLYNYFTDSEIRVITHMVSEPDITSRELNFNTNDADDDANADSLCVICQERQKCVLTLPCRHVCLCMECCRRLYGYQRTCPICRTFIYHSVTIYL